MTLKLLFFPLSLFVSLVILIWMVKPEWDNYKDFQVELIKKQKELEKIQKGIASVGISFDAFSKVNEQTRSLIEYSIPDGIDSEDFLAQIGKSANSSRVLMVSIKTDKEKKRRVRSEEEEISGIVMTGDVEVVGNYPNVRSFINKIEKQNRLTVIDNVSISKIDNLKNSKRIKESPEVDQQQEDGVEGENESEGELKVEELLPVSTDLVRAKVSFKFYARKGDDNSKKLSSMIESKDIIFDSLLSGKFKGEVIDKFKEDITTEVFAPIGSGIIGKQNLFLKED